MATSPTVSSPHRISNPQARRAPPISTPTSPELPHFTAAHTKQPPPPVTQAHGIENFSAIPEPRLLPKRRHRRQASMNHRAQLVPSSCFAQPVLVFEAAQPASTQFCPFASAPSPKCPAISARTNQPVLCRQHLPQSAASP
jgi:hypothetical protein